MTSAEVSGFPNWAHALAVHRGLGPVAAANHGGEVRVWSIADAKQVVGFVAAPGYASAAPAPAPAP